jgi:hypothetical protein
MSLFKRRGKSRKLVPVFICDRSGFKHPITEAVKEPGTGYVVHKTESDGLYSMVCHPQNKPYKPARQTVNRFVQYFRPDTTIDAAFGLLMEDGSFIITEDENNLEYTDTSLD